MRRLKRRGREHNLGNRSLATPSRRTRLGGAKQTHGHARQASSQPAPSAAESLFNHPKAKYCRRAALGIPLLRVTSAQGRASNRFSYSDACPNPPITGSGSASSASGQGAARDGRLIMITALMPFGPVRPACAKVTGKMRFGAEPFSRRLATRRLSAKDFRVPGPAKTRTYRELSAAPGKPGIEDRDCCPRPSRVALVISRLGAMPI
jgi:hypothetical protein